MKIVIDIEDAKHGLFHKATPNQCTHWLSFTVEGNQCSMIGRNDFEQWLKEHEVKEEGLPNGQ